jgi:oxygen-independent coproporphyrinogen-3 oxidase
MMLAVKKLTDARYDYIGLNHFALPHDALSVAANNTHAHRNFHVATVRSTNDLLGFGVSAISKVGTTYSQNMTTIDGYYDRLDRAELPVMRGINLNADDLLRRAVIHSLMHRFELSIESIEIAHLINFRAYFADEWVRLEELERKGIVKLAPDWISVPPSERLLVSSIAIIFDRYISRSAQRERAATVI